jgi:hypothetical protein
MLLRSSCHALALLAANRTNVQKSTQPRTPLGRKRSASNACLCITRFVESGSSSPPRRAPSPDPLRLMKAPAAGHPLPVGEGKKSLENSPLPFGRGGTAQRWVRVGAPAYGIYRRGDLLDRKRNSMGKQPATRTKPEYHSKQGNYEDVTAIADLGEAVRVESAFGPSANVFAPCTGPGTQAQPEYRSRQVSYENIAAIADLGAAVRVASIRLWCRLPSLLPGRDAGKMPAPQLASGNLVRYTQS